MRPFLALVHHRFGRMRPVDCRYILKGGTVYDPLITSGRDSRPDRLHRADLRPKGLATQNRVARCPFLDFLALDPPCPDRMRTVYHRSALIRCMAFRFILDAVLATVGGFGMGLDNYRYALKGWRSS